MAASRRVYLCILVSILLLLIVLLQPNTIIKKEPEDVVVDKLRRNGLYSSWKECILAQMSPSRGNHTKLWNEFQSIATPCNEPYASILAVKEYANSDETKHHISPLMITSNNTIVTLGIGHDIAAEEQLIRALGKENLQFYGADPIHEINSLLYGKIGTFYPVAVAGKAGYSLAEVLGTHGYHRSTVAYVDAIYFLTKMVGQKFYDDLWIDAEGGEYDLLPMFLNGGAFDKNGITICQFNMELHLPNDRKQKIIHDFFFQIMEDERYAFFFPINVGHLRIFFVNFKDEKCLKKYIPQNFDKPL